MQRFWCFAVVIAAVLALGGSSARADTTKTLAPGTMFTTLAVTPANEVWYAAAGPGPHDVRVQRLQPGGPVYRTGAADSVSPILAPRPDGRTWLVVDGRMVLRSRLDGTLQGIPSTLPLPDGAYLAVAAGDGSLLATQFFDGFVRVALDGTSALQTFSPPAPPPPAGAACQAWDLASSPDGSVWISDRKCRRIIHVLPDGTAQNVLLRATADGTPEAPEGLLVTPAGALWVWTSTDGHANTVEHLVGGAAQQLLLPATAQPTAWSLAPDGSVWFGDAGACALWHLSGAGVERRPAPFPVAVTQVAPDGSLWLQNAGHLAHVTPASLQAPQRCDTRAPRITLPDVRRPVIETTLGALRRAGGVRVRSDETGTAYGELRVAGSKITFRMVIGRRTRTIAMPAAVLSTLARRLRRGIQTQLGVQIQMDDLNGNHGGSAYDMGVRR